MSMLRFSAAALLLLGSAAATAAQDNTYNTESLIAVDPFDLIDSLQAGHVEADIASIDSAATSEKPPNNPLLGGQISLNSVLGKRLPPATPPLSANKRFHLDKAQHSGASEDRHSHIINSSHDPPVQQPASSSSSYSQASHSFVQHAGNIVQPSTSRFSGSIPFEQNNKEESRNIPAKYRNALTFEDSWYNLIDETYKHADIAILLDDSQSMCEREGRWDGKSYVNSRGEIDGTQRPRSCKRWEEAIEWLDVMLAAIKVSTFGRKLSDVFFLNKKRVFRGVVYGNTEYYNLKDYIISMDDFGGTPSGRAIKSIFAEHKGRHKGTPYPLVVYFITDGDPQDEYVFDNEVTNKPLYYFISIRATTDKKDKIEHLNYLDKAVRNFDVTDDFWDERNEIMPRYREIFDYPRYVLKFLMGPFVSELDLLDEAIGSEMERKVSVWNLRENRKNLDNLRNKVVAAIDWKGTNQKYHRPETADRLDAALKNDETLVRAHPIQLKKSTRKWFGNLFGNWF